VITIDREFDGSDWLPFVTVGYKGQTTFSIHLVGDEARGREEPTAEVRIMKIDPSTTAPQVVFTYFWGGAHCCTVTKIASIDAQGNWHVVDAGILDGDDGYEFKDLDGDGGSELISVDNSFLYAFGCYACSYAPARIKKLVGTNLNDVTADGRYRDFMRQQLREMEANARTYGDKETFHSNGYLGGWVAAKSIVGELSEAWQTMLASYDRNPDWTMEECLRPLPLNQCPDTEKRQIDFPKALATHLTIYGYITAEEKRKLDSMSKEDKERITSNASDDQPESGSYSKQDTSTALVLCSTALNNPLRQMILDALVSGGKHLGGRLNDVKDELEKDYGSFLKVHNDATEEKVDEKTRKVGCAVTYEADLQGLAEKVLEEGATARAQILIRQIAEEGKVISRRLAYTVQRTSGGSVMVWFGMPTTEAAPHRRVGRCVLFYGSRCVVWR
jgi:hypothetical protein